MSRKLLLVKLCVMFVPLVGCATNPTHCGYTVGFMITKPPSMSTTNSLAAMQTIPMPTFAVESNPAVTVLSQSVGQIPRCTGQAPQLQIQQQLAPQRAPCGEPAPQQLPMPKPVRDTCPAGGAE